MFENSSKMQYHMSFTKRASTTHRQRSDQSEATKEYPHDAHIFTTSLRALRLSRASHSSMANPQQTDNRVSAGAIDDALRTLQRRVSILLEEFQAFAKHLQLQNKQNDVEMRIYRRGLEAEVQMLDALVPSALQSANRLEDATVALSRHAQLARTSNIPHLGMWWSCAKRCKGITGLGRRLPVGPSPLDRRTKGTKQHQKRGEDVQVDIICDDGRKWIKISTVTEKRLLFDMAKEGWEANDETSGTDEVPYPSQHVRHSQDEIPTTFPLLSLATSLHRASLSTRTPYAHPNIHLLLPNLQLTPQTPPQMRHLLAAIHSLNITIETGRPLSTPNTPQDSANSTLFHHMSPSTHPPHHHPHPTNTLNIDTSILIALLSDQCHHPALSQPHQYPTTHSPSSTYRYAIHQQDLSELRSPILPNELYPLLVGRKMVCATIAAERARTIVKTMGSDTERERCALLLPTTPPQGSVSDAQAGDMGSGEGGSDAKADGGQRRKRWKQLSSWDLPEGVNLSVDEIDINPLDLLASVDPDHEEAGTDSVFPKEVAERLMHATKLSDLNAAVLLLGWSRGIVTVTANAAAVGQIEKGVGGVLDDLERERGEVIEVCDGVGPHQEAANQGALRMPMFWLLSGSRSLVGRPKGAP